MTAIAKSAKRHPAAKKCCGWEEPAICPMKKFTLLAYSHSSNCAKSTQIHCVDVEIVVNLLKD